MKNLFSSVVFLFLFLLCFVQPSKLHSQISYSCNMDNNCGNIWDNNGFVDTWGDCNNLSDDACYDNVWSSDSRTTMYNNSSITGHTGGNITVTVDVRLLDYYSPYPDRSSTEWGDLKVYYKTSVPSEASPGTQIGSTVNSSSDCQTHSFSFSPGTTITDLYLSFEYNFGSGDNYIIFDNVTITESANVDPPVADFSANQTTTHLNEIVTFTDLSTNSPTTWSWSFSPSTVTFQNSTTGQSQNPQVQFDASGLYRVTLLAENAYGFDDEIKVDYITVVDGYIIPSSGTSSVTACSGSLFDSQGSAADYLASDNGSITIYPSSAGQKVNIQGNVAIESGWHYVRVYDGTSTSATLLQEASGSGIAINQTANNVDGALTIALVGDGFGGVGYGADLAIACVTPCTGTPVSPTATVTEITDLCPASQVNLTVSGYEVGSGISYDWEYSSDGSTGWTSLGSANPTIYPTSNSNQSLGNFWRYKTTCSSSGLSSYSNIAERVEPSVTSGGDLAECGSFSGSLSASTNSGSVEWYAASSGGSALSTGDNYSPGNGSTTTYYAASSSCPSARTAITATVNANPTPSASASAAGVCSGGSVDLTGNGVASTSIDATISPGSTITNGSPVSSTYEVSGHGGSASDLSSITLNITHTWNDDLDITLTAPNGSSIDLTSDNGGSSDNYTNTVFSASGSTSITSGTGPFTGTYTPEQAFSNLTGASDGTWTLTVTDDAGGDDGTLISWSINIPAITISGTYAWSSDVGAFTSSDQNPTGASPSETTTYTLSFTDGNGCTGTASTEVSYDTPSTTSLAIGLATQGGTAVSSGATMRFDQGVTMTGTGNGTINICYNWDTDVAGASYAGQDWTSGYEWTNTGGGFLNGADNRTLYLRTKNVNNVTCYSDAVNIVVRKPLVSASSSMTAFSNCEGTAASAQSFTVTGEHLTGDLTVSPPTGFEVSKASGSGYSTSSISFTPVNGAVTNETVYVRVTAAASSGSPSGDITISTTHNLDNVSTTTSTTVSVSGTVTAVPSISSVTDGSNCGTGTVDLSAAVSNGTINWYAASSGGASLGSGTSFTTPSLSSTTTYYVDGTDGSCVTGSRSAVTATILANPVSGSLSVDLSESLSTQTINWTNSGTAEGTCQYYYQWSDDNASAPTGSWTAWDITVNQSWAASNAGPNMNRVLWVKTITTSGVGCGTAETTPVATDVINCKENGLSASASAGTVANLPFGETITYTTGAPLDGSFERLQYQWGGTGGSWTDWETSNPYAYTTNINAGQTLYVRSKISNTTSAIACEDYTDPIETFIIDCASTSVTSVTSNEASSSTELTCVNTEINVTASGADSYTWSDGASTDATRDLTSGATYTVTGTFSNGCTSTADITITENNTAPSVSVTSNETSSSTVVTCTNAAISVTASGADSYTWSDGSSTASSRDLTSAATYTVTGTDASNGCTNTAQITVTENTTAPSVSLTNNESGSETEVTCANTEISVTASGADSYTWSDGASTASSRDLTAAATYTVTGTDASNGCTNTAQITITENTTTPSAYAGDDFTIGCTDNTSGASIGVTDEADNYSTWASGDDGGSGFDAWSISTPSGTGYFLGNPANDGMSATGIGSNAFGFYSTQGNQLTATRPLTNAMAVGDEMTFYWSMNYDGGSKGFYFESSSSSVYTVYSNGSATIFAGGSTAHTNYGTNAMLVTLRRISSSQYEFSMTPRGGGGTYTDTLDQSASIDAITIFISNNDGDSYRNIYFNKFNLAQSGATYAWTSTSGLSASNVAAPSANPSSTTTYTLTVTGSNGCTNTDQVTVTVDNVEPTVVGSSSVTDVTTCGLASLNVEVESNGASGTWSNDFIGLFDNNTDASTLFQTSTFNEDMTLTWTNTSGGCSGSTTTITARFNQPTATGSMDTDSWVWGGLTNPTWSTGSNWYKWDGSKWVIQSGSYPDAGCKIYILPTSDVCVDSNPTNAAASIGDLNIQGGTFDFGSSNTTVTGNITNDGTITGGSGTITIAASGDQTISGSGTVNFNNLVVNKSSGNLILSSATNVGSTLTMTKGNIVNSQPLVLGSSSASPGTLSHSSGVITGEFRKYFANQTGSTFFPIGTSSNMRDVTVNFTSAPGSNQYLTASYVAGKPTLQDGSDYNGLPLTTDDGQLIQNYSEDGYWVINPTGDDYNSTINSASYTIDLHCKNLTIQPSDVSKVRIIKSAGSNTAGSHHASWTGLTNQSTSGSASDFTVTGTSTGFSFFGAGSEDGNPLPVELVSFSGACNDGLVELIWETASEYNSSHFDVENSRDGITWDVVKTIEAAGNSNELLTYGYNDVNAHGGDNYYRLTQVDIDGTSKTYDVINVSCAQTTSGYFSIFPNPSSGSFQVMLNNSDIVGRAEMNIVDTKGNKVFMKSIDVKSGINMFVINENLAPGIYYVSVKNGDKTTKVLKHSVK